MWTRFSTGAIVEEQSKVVTLLFEDTLPNETALDEIIVAYLDQFHQESVLSVIDETVDVAFEPSSNTTVPEPSSIFSLLVLAILGIKMEAGAP